MIRLLPSVSLLIAFLIASTITWCQRDSFISSGFKYLQEAEYELARQQFDLLLDRDWWDGEGQLGMGIAQYHLGDKEAARDAFEVSVENVEGDARPWFWLGKLAYEAKQFDVALDAFVVVRQLQPDRPELAYLKGVTHLELAQYDEAQAFLEEAVEETPDNAYAWHYLGMAYLGNHIHEEARVALQRALELEPFLPRFHRGMGDLAADQMQWFQAAAHYQTAVRYNPKYGEGWYRQALSLHEAGLHRRAEVAAARAMELMPNDGWSIWIRAQAAFASGQSKQCRSLLVEHWDDLPLPVEAKVLMGKCYAAEGMYDSMDITFADVETLEPGRDDVQETWALAYYKRGKLGKAGELYAKCLLRNPRDGFYAYNLAVVRLEEGRKSDACEVLKTVDLSAEGSAMQEKITAFLADNCTP